MPVGKKDRTASRKGAKTAGALTAKKAVKPLPPREVRRELVRVLCIVNRGFVIGRLKDQTMLTTVHTARGSRVKTESLSRIVQKALLSAGVTIVTKPPAKAGA